MYSVYLPISNVMFSQCYSHIFSIQCHHHSFSSCTKHLRAPHFTHSATPGYTLFTAIPITKPSNMLSLHSPFNLTHFIQVLYSYLTLLIFVLAVVYSTTMSLIYRGKGFFNRFYRHNHSFCYPLQCTSHNFVCSILLSLSLSLHAPILT